MNEFYFFLRRFEWLRSSLGGVGEGTATPGALGLLVGNLELIERAPSTGTPSIPGVGILGAPIIGILGLPDGRVEGIIPDLLPMSIGRFGTEGLPAGLVGFSSGSSSKFS